MSNGNKHHLIVPLSAADVTGLKPGQTVKVLGQTGDKTVVSQIIKLNVKGQGEATLAFKTKPRSLRVVVGPADASDRELLGLQTLTINVPIRRWREAKFKLPITHITNYHWHWWLRWCRTYTIRGRVLCPDGTPVPGAKVCAFDVDYLWWWRSKQQVGCATTDASGIFEITFRFCCGWWPWWWWQHRHWHFAPEVARQIMPKLERSLKLHHTPQPVPNFDIFKALIGDGDHQASLTIQPPFGHRPIVIQPPIGEKPVVIQPKTQPPMSLTRKLDPNKFIQLRKPLLERLPHLPIMEKWHIWPWHPHLPWHDCTPDIIFKVTQEQNDNEVVLLEEGYSDTRWNIPTTLGVNLTASAQAWCVPDTQDCIDGNCVAITHVCHYQVDTIAGNIGAPVAIPAGYQNPGSSSAVNDRPFAGAVTLSGTVDCMDGVDYYEFEWSDDGGGTWFAMPPAAVATFTRSYYNFNTFKFTGVAFTPLGLDGPVDTRLVYKTLQRYEADNPLALPANWGGTHVWVGYSKLLLMNWLTAGNFADGTYHLRIVGWDVTPANKLSNRRVLQLCGSQQEATAVVRLDNRVVGLGSGHPTSPAHPVGPETLHTETREPDTDILAVHIVRRGTLIPVRVCGAQKIKSGDILRIDFFAHDPDGHLAYYTLDNQYGENSHQQLLALPGVSLTPSPVAAPVPAALQVGPGYNNARLQGATSPTWRGGAVRLEIPAEQAFPETCCYQLELRAYKRTIVNCNSNVHAGQQNLSTYSFAITR